MISRRRLLEGAGVGAVVAGDRPRRDRDSEAAPLNLPAALPAGTRGEAVLEALPGKKPLIKLSYRPPNFETPIDLLRAPRSRRTTRSSCAIISPTSRRSTPRPGGSRSAATAPMARSSSRSTTSRRCRRPRSPPSASARATAAACSSRTCRASNGATAPWAARAGRAPGSRTCSTRVGLKKEAIEIVFDGADGPASRQDPGFRQEHPGVEGDRGHHAGRLRDERRSRCRTGTAFRRASSCPAGPRPTGSSTSPRSARSPSRSTASG